MDDLCNRVAAFVRNLGLLEAGGHVLVAFSGGPDSVALVLILGELSSSGRLPLDLRLAHLNHRLREEADEEEDFCRRFAREQGLPLTVERADVGRLARGCNGSVESVARRVRYEFLARTARAVAAPTVATAHHADDVAETVLMRLLRGAGVRGLGAMRPRRPLCDDIALVRPLMNVRKHRLIAYLEDHGQPFCRDTSNRDTDYVRNRVRHRLIPLLQGEYPHFSVESLVALNEAAIETADLVEGAVDELWPALRVECEEGAVVLDAAVYEQAPPAVRKAAAARALRRLGMPDPLPLRAEHYRALAGLAGRGPGFGVSLPGGLHARREHGVLHFGRPGGRAAPPSRELPVPGSVEAPECGYRINARICPEEVGPQEARQRASEREVFLAAERVRTPLNVRTRRPGDRFHPLGAPGRKRLKEFFIEARVPRHRRDRIALVTDAQDRIVWVVGHRIDDRFRLLAAGQPVLHLQACRTVAEST